MNDLLKSIGILYNGLTNLFAEKFFPAIIIPTFGVLFGLDNPLILRALLILVVFDFITGIASAYIAGESIRSKVAVRSALKLAVYGLLVSAGHLTEQVTPIATFIEESVTTFLALTELISIIENAGKMGFAVPKKLLNQLHKFREDDIVLIETKTVNETHDKRSGIIEKHVVEEKLTESHSVSKPNEPLG